MKRRDFINYTALAGAGVAIDALWTRTSAQSRTPGATVKTANGSLRGYVDNGVHVFKGVPYAASTAGANRFHPPQKRAPWSGVRDAVQFGERPPQVLGGEPAEMLPTDPREPLGEDCLVMNIWTPNPAAGQRPVMVWLHGGGFASGSGSYSIYEGRELARKHDVVSISINHRLNVLGFLYLAQYGGKWADASNVGMLDIVAALEWVRDNIAAFGGDPRNVTIFGQSGGAGKVSTLMAMPAARGLFHRAIAQSGAALTAIPVEQAVKTTEQILQRLKITPDRLDQLQTVPFAQLIDVLRPAAGPPLPGAGPVLDGKSLPVNPFDPAAPVQSASVPFLTGTTATEMTFFAPDDQLMPIDEATLRTARGGAVEGGRRRGEPDDRAVSEEPAWAREHRSVSADGDGQRAFPAAGRGAGGTESRTAGRAGVCVPVRVLLAGPRGAPQVDALHGDSVRLRQSRRRQGVYGDQSRGAADCRSNERGLGRIRADGESQPPRHSAVARVHRHRAIDDGLRE